MKKNSASWGQVLFTLSSLAVMLWWGIKTQERANQSDERLEKVVSQAFDLIGEMVDESQAIVKTNKQGIVTYANEKAVKEFDLFVGSDIHNSIIPEEMRAEHHKAFAKSMAHPGEKVVTQDVPANYADGKQRLTRVRMLKTPNGAMAILSPVTGQ